MRISDWSSDVCSADLSDGLATLNRLAIAIYRPGRQFALAVGERLVKLHREGVGEIVEDIFARSDVDLHVAPILGRDLGQAALHQRLAGGDDLDDGGVAVLEIALDRKDSRRRLPACDVDRKRGVEGQSVVVRVKTGG